MRGRVNGAAASSVRLTPGEECGERLPKKSVRIDLNLAPTGFAGTMPPVCPTRASNRKCGSSNTDAQKNTCGALAQFPNRGAPCSRECRRVVCSEASQLVLQGSHAHHQYESFMAPRSTVWFLRGHCLAWNRELREPAIRAESSLSTLCAGLAVQRHVRTTGVQMIWRQSSHASLFGPSAVGNTPPPPRCAACFHRFQGVLFRT